MGLHGRILPKFISGTIIWLGISSNNIEKRIVLNLNTVKQNWEKQDNYNIGKKIYWDYKFYAIAQNL